MADAVRAQESSMPRHGGYIEVTVKIEREDDQWAAVCVELGTAACGDTIEEAMVAIGDMILLHLNALEDAGTCRRFLADHNVTLHRRMPRRPAAVPVPVRPGQFVTRLTECLNGVVAT